MAAPRVVVGAAILGFVASVAQQADILFDAGEGEKRRRSVLRAAVKRGLMTANHRFVAYKL